MIIRLESKDLEHTSWNIIQKILRLAAKEQIRVTPKLAEKFEKGDFYNNEKRLINNIFVYIYAFKNSNIPLQSMHHKLYKE